MKGPKETANNGESTSSYTTTEPNHFNTGLILGWNGGDLFEAVEQGMKEMDAFVCTPRGTHSNN